MVAQETHINLAIVRRCVESSQWAHIQTSLMAGLRIKISQENDNVVFADWVNETIQLTR